MTQLTDRPLLSVIIPVYGTEKTLTRCLDSVLHCTYPNLEVIVVNDCSKGNASEIISSYLDSDSRVQLIEHEKNKGLFLVRMTGMKAAHGKYIAFLDSDDHVSADFYRRLVEKAEATDSDMVLGEVLLEYPDHYTYNNLFHTRIQDIDLRGDSVKNLLFDQSGRDYSLHVVWNKIYRRDLVEKCLPYLALQTEHLIMCEDILYSSVFYYFSQHLTNIHGDFVYYVQDDDSSTGLDGNTKKYIKNIKDIQHVFHVLNIIFEKELQDTTLSSALNSWQKRLVRIWRRNINESNLSIWKKQKLLRLIDVSKKETEQYAAEDNCFYEIFTTIKELPQEKLKETINQSETKIISFDIFDTLVWRPFWNPTDLFYLVGIYANQLLKAGDLLDFKDIRITAEKRAREVGKIQHPSWEEITLDDIYDVIQEYLGLTDAQRNHIRDKEIELEIKYCHPRTYAKEIFDLCKTLGKKVIITSDMYLPKDTIEKILTKCGYQGYEKLYLSSDVKLGKWSGHLFQFACKDLAISPEAILHIGDNQDSDVTMAHKQGLQSMHFPKAVDRFMNVVPKLYGGDLFNRLYGSPFALRDGYQFMRFFGLQCLMAVAANQVFANPYVQFNTETDFNADPCVIGTLALGPHMFAVAKWLADEVKENQYDNLNFMARDGYLAQLCFKELNRVYHLTVRQDYLYLTRSVMLPLQIDNPYDLDGMVPNFNIFNQTPRKMFNEFKNIMSNELYEKQELFCQQNDFLIDKEFSSLDEFYAFVKVFKDHCLDLQKLAAYKEKIYQYLKPSFQGKTATFDVGYSCRVESNLRRNYGFDVTPYYIHINNHFPIYRAQKRDMEFHTFYQYSPGVTGIIRELLISEQAPSCDSLEIKDGTVIPVFKEYHPSYMENYIVSIIQCKALDYVHTMVNLFGEDVHYLYYQREDASLAFEYYSAMAKLKDRQIFAYSDFEDELELGKTVSTFDFWNRQVENVASGVSNSMDLSLHWIPSKWQRAICLYYMNRDYLKYKVSVKLENKPKQLAALKGLYRGARKIYRTFTRRK